MGSETAETAVQILQGVPRVRRGLQDDGAGRMARQKAGPKCLPRTR